MAKKFKDFVVIVEDGMSRSQVESCIYRLIYTLNLFQVTDDLLTNIDKRFNNKKVDIVDASKCLHPFDSFKLFD